MIGARRGSVHEQLVMYSRAVGSIRQGPRPAPGIGESRGLSLGHMVAEHFGKGRTYGDMAAVQPGFSGRLQMARVGYARA